MTSPATDSMWFWQIPVFELGPNYREQPNVVLIDIMMPLVDSFDVLRKPRRDPASKNLPVILLIAVPEIEVERLAVEFGANRYVTKPQDPATFYAVIKVAIREAARAGGATANDHDAV